MQVCDDLRSVPPGPKPSDTVECSLLNIRQLHQFKKNCTDWNTMFTAFGLKMLEHQHFRAYQGTSSIVVIIIVLIAQ